MSGEHQRNGLTYKQKRTVEDVLKTVCREKDGFAEFLPGHDDESVAKMAISALGGTMVTANNVAGIRREMIGPTRTPIKPDADTIAAALTSLRNRITLLEAEAELREARLDRLEEEAARR